MKPGSLYWPARALSSPFRRHWFDVTLENIENVPTTGAVILAPNHISFLDSFLLMSALRRKVIFMGKAEYLDSWKTRIFPAAGMIPVDRSGRAVAGSLRQAAKVLDKGGVIGIFPEGTRSTDGKVHQGQPGAAYLAQRTSAALVPVGIVGTDLAQPPDARFPDRGVKITFRFGAPMGLGVHGRGSSGRKTMTRELMRNIAVLAGRPYANYPADRATFPVAA